MGNERIEQDEEQKPLTTFEKRNEENPTFPVTDTSSEHDSSPKHSSAHSVSTSPLESPARSSPASDTAESENAESTLHASSEASDANECKANSSPSSSSISGAPQVDAHPTLVPSESAEIKAKSQGSVRTQWNSVNDYIYHVKWIKFRGKSRPIITQNENGPCPIIAIANVLLLRGTVNLPEDTEIVTGQRLSAILSDVLLSQSVKGLDDGQLLNYETTVSDALNLFPSLQTGLDINVRFTGVFSFEYTPSLGIFDLFKICLCHGWLVDPADRELTQIIAERTYNQLAEQVIQLKASSDMEDVRKGLLVDSFLDQTASQLTYHGLCELTSAISEGQLAVLFRNNHFSTIFKNEGRIHVLVTDMGLLHEPNIVWEALNDVDGDTQFVNSSFKLYTPAEGSGQYLVPTPSGSQSNATCSTENQNQTAPVASGTETTSIPISQSVSPTQPSGLNAIKTTGEPQTLTDNPTEKAKIAPSVSSLSDSLKNPNSLAELAKTCSDDPDTSSDLSMAAQLQLEEIELSQRFSRKGPSKETQKASDSLRKPNGVWFWPRKSSSLGWNSTNREKPNASLFSSTSLSQVCSQELIAHAKLESATDSDLALAMRLQQQEIDRVQPYSKASTMASASSDYSISSLGSTQRAPTGRSAGSRRQRSHLDSSPTVGVSVSSHRNHSEVKSSCRLM
ncbi:unnamed protein product [Calicophoron daubneyi]|uniref:Ubiquitin carboxyl-terminal hydrolase n=1 Tax=Calicophoron daubneyi TaxID=300641 RepID=A0AAV2TLW0_CALDB